MITPSPQTLSPSSSPSHIAGHIRRDEINNLTIHSELQIFNVKHKITDKKKEWHYTFNEWTLIE
jgi:hypothetical protein